MHLRHNGAGHDVPRRQFLRLVIALHKTFQVDVAENASFPAKRLRKQETRGALDGQGRRMKLNELEIGKNRAGLVGDGQPVAGGHIGIGGLAVNMTQATGG